MTVVFSLLLTICFVFGRDEDHILDRFHDSLIKLVRAIRHLLVSSKAPPSCICSNERVSQSFECVEDLLSFCCGVSGKLEDHSKSSLYNSKTVSLRYQRNPWVNRILGVSDTLPKTVPESIRAIFVLGLCLIDLLAKLVP